MNRHNEKAMATVLPLVEVKMQSFTFPAGNLPQTRDLTQMEQIELEEKQGLPESYRKEIEARNKKTRDFFGRLPEKSD